MSGRGSKPQNVSRKSILNETFLKGKISEKASENWNEHGEAWKFENVKHFHPPNISPAHLFVRQRLQIQLIRLYDRRSTYIIESDKHKFQL